MKLIFVYLFLFSCSLTDVEHQQFDLYQIKITGVLTADGLDTLKKDVNGYYHLILDRHKRQTIRRVTGYILKNNKEPYPPEKIEWESNLYWWLLRNDTVAQITKTYFNEFTGVLQTVKLPPLISKKDELVPTINCCSYSGTNGEINTIIAPINNMNGDTLIVQAYNYNSKKTIHTKIVLE